VDLSCSPRVVSPVRPDLYNLETMLASPQFSGKQGEALVLAIYDYLTSRIDGIYHFWPADEQAGNPKIRRRCLDPVKLLNAYGWTICGQAAHLLYAIYRKAGLKARVYSVPGHVLCEVFYDGRWHVLDVDMWTWFRTPEGHIASAYELASNPTELILNNPNRSNPCNLPDRSLEDYAKMYAKCPTVDGHVESIFPHWQVIGHTMDFHLRPGETLIRSQLHQGRFHMPQAWKEFMKKFPHEWHGHPRERFEPFRTFGNGRWIYEPRLESGWRDFAEGLWLRDGLKQDDAGLLGPGEAVFRIQSPYPFCGIPDWRGERVKTSGGVWLFASGSGPVEVQITDPEGNWVTVLSVRGPFERQVDITGLLDARYECLLRFNLSGGARLRRFRFDGFVMTAPMSIPRLVEGENQMEIRCGDKYGLCTVPWTEVVDFREGADLLGRACSVQNARIDKNEQGWLMIAPEEPDTPVSATFRFTAPANRPFAWAYVLGIVREASPQRQDSQATIEWSSDGRTWQRLACQKISNTPKQWDTTIDGEALFQQPAENVWIRITSATAICGLEFYGHILDRSERPRPLEVVHHWKEQDSQRQFAVPSGETRYTILCGSKPAGHTITTSVPSMPEG